VCAESVLAKPINRARRTEERKHVAVNIAMSSITDSDEAGKACIMKYVNVVDRRSEAIFKDAIRYSKGQLLKKKLTPK